MGFHFLHLPPELAEQFARDQFSLPALRDFIERRIEADIAVLDAIDGDPDLEPSLGSLGHSGFCGQTSWAGGGSDDRENAECGYCDGEPVPFFPPQGAAA